MSYTSLFLFAFSMSGDVINVVISNEKDKKTRNDLFSKNVFGFFQSLISISKCLFFCKLHLF